MYTYGRLSVLLFERQTARLCVGISVSVPGSRCSSRNVGQHGRDSVPMDINLNGQVCCRLFLRMPVIAPGCMPEGRTVSL